MKTTLPAARTDPPGGDVRIGMAIAFVLTFVVRWQTVFFVNDHFTHLSRARQIVLGEWPIRDFFDPGQFLHYYPSAVALSVFGYNLFGEALLTVSFFALAAAITFGIATRLARSQTIAACATVTAVAAFPRLYNYPKAFLYVTAISLAWWYAHRPDRVRLRVIAAFSTLAFLFRYDHGVYIAAMMIVLLVLVHVDRPRQWLVVVGTYGALFCLFLLPFVAYVQWAAGVPEYVRASQGSATIVLFDLRRLGLFAINGSIAELRSPAAAPVAPAPSSVGAAPAPVAPAPAAAPARTAWHLFSPQNALTFFYYATVTLPYAALLIAMWAWWRGRINRPEAATVIAAACVSLVINRGLLANNVDARLADVACPTAVLGAWVAGRWLAVPTDRTHRAGILAIKRLSLRVVFIITLWSVATQAHFIPLLRTYHALDGPRAAWQQTTTAYRRLWTRPIDDWAPPDERRGIRVLARYVWRCTAPDDRLLIAGRFAPEVYFYADRSFAGGAVSFLQDWHQSLPEQRLTIDRLRHQSVPIVLMGDMEPLFQQRFGYVADYIRRHYVEVANSSFNGEGSWRVLVERGRTPVGTDPVLGLPCFRTPLEE